MANDEADFQAFANAAMAQASATDPALTAPVVESSKETPTTEPVKIEPAAGKEPEPAKVEPKPDETPEEIPAWKKAAEQERAKRAQKTNEKALQAKLASVEAELSKWKAIEAKRATDPLGAAEEAGFSYDKLTKEYIKTLERNPDAPARDPETKAEVTALNQKLQQVETLLQQLQQTNEQRAQAEWAQSFQAEVAKEFETKGDALEYVKKDPQGPDLVREIRAAHYRSTATFDEAGNITEPGEIMPVSEACRLAELKLEQYLGHFKGAKKFGAAKAEETSKPAERPAQAAPTLSQDMRQGGVKPTESHGTEVEQLLLLKKTLEAQLDAQQG